MQIRQYKPSDLEGVIDTWESASQVGHPFLSERFLESERKKLPSVYLPNGNVWVATIDASVAGFIILHGNEVGALFARPECHGRGVGFALMNKVRHLHDHLEVDVFKENVIGNKFYLKYGFELVDEYLHEETSMMMLCLEYRADGLLTCLKPRCGDQAR